MRSAIAGTTAESCVGWIAGVDEVGRGPLAGPVVAAAVILPVVHGITGLRDSKKLSASARARLDVEIRSVAIAWAIGEASVTEIDRLDILKATFLAMQRAVAALSVRPDRILVDGNRAPAFGLPTDCIVGGDDLVAAISAASILAKQHRDGYMLQLAAHYPAYGFDRHMGYPTPAHLAALAEHGPCAMHRHSFAPVRRAALLQRGGGPAAPGRVGASADLSPGASAAEDAAPASRCSDGDP